MKKYILPLIHICIIPLALISFISCAEMPAGENSFSRSDNNLLLFQGLYHALILPLSVIGKIFGFSIGLYSTDGNAAYWIGFLLGLMAYGKLFGILGKISEKG